MTYINEEVKDIDSKIFKLAAPHLSKLVPSNTDYILQKAPRAKSKIRFEYDILYEYGEKLQKLKELKPPKGVFKKVYKDKKKEIKTKLKLIENIGTRKFYKFSKKLYGKPDKKLIESAHRLLELPPSKPGVKIDNSQAKKILENQLIALNIDWEIKNKKMISYASVLPSIKEVRIKSNYEFAENTIRRLAIHEIGTHGVRSMNGRMQPLRIFRNFPNYIVTEEGLAVFNEEICGVLNNDTIRKYAGRVIAVDYAKNHNLQETYKELQKYFDNETAMYIAFRVKRGVDDSESTGSFTKDHVYLKGFYKIQKFAKKNPLNKLYYGKINLDYMNLIEKIEPELNKIKYFPPFIQSFEVKKKVFGKIGK